MKFIQTLDETVERMKKEVLGLIDQGRVPEDVASFSELHNFIDANELGGLCEDEVVDPLIEYFGGRDGDEAMPDAYMDYMNAAQNAIDDWLKEGRP